MEKVIIGGIASVVGILVGFMLDRIRRGAAYQRRDEIVQQAEREAENIRKSQELASKEELLMEALAGAYPAVHGTLEAFRWHDARRLRPADGSDR